MNCLEFNMDNLCKHHKIDRVDHDCYLFTWSLPAASWINELDVGTLNFELNDYYYFATMGGSKHDLAFSITTNACGVKCSVSLYLGSGTFIYSNTLKEATREDHASDPLYHYDLISLSYDSEHYQKVKQHPNDSLIFICRIKFRVEDFCSLSVLESDCASADTLSYMKKLADALKNSSESSLREKVALLVGEETEFVNKAVLCARSPVFAEMFRNNTREVKGDVVSIPDFKMHVMKALVSFLYTGKLSKSDIASNGDCDIDSLFELYRAADKYGITELRHACVDLLLPHISMENIFRVSKFAFAHSDERLKSTVKTLIAANIHSLVDENEWKDMMKDEPGIAVEAVTFFDI